MIVSFDPELTYDVPESLLETTGIIEHADGSRSPVDASADPRADGPWEHDILLWIVTDVKDEASLNEICAAVKSALHKLPSVRQVECELQVWDDDHGTITATVRPNGDVRFAAEQIMSLANGWEAEMNNNASAFVSFVWRSTGDGGVFLSPGILEADLTLRQWSRPR